MSWFFPGNDSTYHFLEEMEPLPLRLNGLNSIFYISNNTLFIFSFCVLFLCDLKKYMLYLQHTKHLEAVQQL